MPLRLRSCNYLKVVYHTMQMANRFALPIRMENADSRALQGRDALVAIINVIKVDAPGTSHITCATTQTESRMQPFHLIGIQKCHYSSKFLLAMGASLVLQYKVAFQF